MAGATIPQRIALEGADQIKQALQQIGEAGRSAFQQIREAGQSVKLDAVEGAAKRAGVSVEEMRARSRRARHPRYAWRHLAGSRHPGDRDGEGDPGRRLGPE